MLFVITLIRLVFFVRAYYKYTPADYLDSLDYIICSQIRDPTEKYGEELFEHLDKYYDSLENLLDKLRQKDTSAGEGIAMYWAMGRPKFTIDFDVPVFERLEKSLQKSNLDEKIFYSKLKRVKQLWEEFKDECEKNKEFCEPTPNPF